MQQCVCSSQALAAGVARCGQKRARRRVDSIETRSGLSLQVGDDGRTLLGLLEARERHLGLRNVLLWVLEVIEERLFVPHDAGLGVGLGVREPLDGTRRSADDAVQIRSLFVRATSIASVALRAARLKQLLAQSDVTDGDRHDGKLKHTLGPEKKGDREGEFNDPRGITCDNTTLYICDTNNYRIQCILKDKYNVQRSWGTYGIENGQFEFPSSILFYENILHVGDKYCVQLFTCDGIFLQRIGGDEVGKEEGLFNWIKGICVVEDKLYVSDCFNDRVQVFKRSSWCS